MTFLRFLIHPFPLLFFLFFSPITDTEAQSPYKLVCYYTNWAIYRPSLAKYTPQNINPYLCTHLIYAFGGLSGKFEVKPFDAYNDIQQGNIKKFVDLKKHNPKLKTMVAIGGWNEGSKKFSAMVSARENRQKFIRSAMKFLREHKFDGLDLDWEYPTFRDGSHPEDREGYALLVKELRETFDDEPLKSGKEKLLLSMAVPAGQQYIDQGYDITSLARDLDFINLLTYDYYTAEEPTVQHHAPLYQVGEFEDWEYKKNYNVDWTVNYYVELGVPSNKIILGIPAYGRAFTLDGEETEFGSAAKGAAEAGASTREGGYLSYYEICQNVLDKDWTVETPEPDAVGPYAHKGDQWVGYDDEEMVVKKTKYAIEHNLGGVMFWSLDNDDFRGNCGGEKSPLVSAARKVLVSAKSKPSKSSGSRTTKKVTTRRPTTTTTTTTTTTETPQDIGEEYQDYEEENLELSATSNERADRQASCQFGTKRGRRGRGRDCKEEEGETAAEDYEEDPLTTPEPPTTPDPGPQFECKDEGFFLNPKDCRKYFWCLDSGPADLGIVPHHFTCPSGLFFNVRSDSCDYKENVSCKMKTEVTTTPRPRSTTARAKPRRRTTTTTESAPEEEVVEEEVPAEEEKSGTADKNPNIAQLLHLIEKLGGVEEVQKHLGGDAETSLAATTTKRTPGRRRTTAAATTSTRKPKTTRRTTTTTESAPEEEEATTRAPSFRRRGPTRRKSTTTTAESIVEDAIVDNSRQSSTVQKFQQVNDEQDKTGTKSEKVESGGKATTTTAGDEPGTDSDTHTSGATRIPGLFNYVVLHRTTTEELPVAAQLKSILDKIEIQTSNNDEKEDIAADQSTVADITAVNEEASSNVQVTALQQAPETSNTAPPFEDIGVRIEEPSEDAGADLQLEQAQNRQTSVIPELPPEVISEQYDYEGDDYAITETLTGPDLVQVEVAAPTTPAQITTTEAPTTTTTEPPRTTNTPVLRRKAVVLRPRSSSTALPVKTTATSEAVTTAITRRVAALRPNPPPRVAATSTPTTSSTTPAPSRSFRTTTTTTRRPTPNPDDPLAVRVKLNRRPHSGAAATVDDFQGLIVDELGELECSEQGVYPHPTECDKFVSCVSIQGHIKAWTYVCPVGQMYDDFTGRCLDEDVVECFTSK